MVPSLTFCWAGGVTIYTMKVGGKGRGDASSQGRGRVLRWREEGGEDNDAYSMVVMEWTTTKKERKMSFAD